MIVSEAKNRIRQHYDIASSYYHSLWGIHIHHGYWKTGTESKEEAQENLIRLLIDKAQIKNNQRILDVGCGMGGSSIYLTQHLHADVIGITLSPIQVAMAKKFAEQCHVQVDFRVMDAEHMHFNQNFDIVWSVEALSHLNNQKLFFKHAAQILSPQSTLVITDWFSKENISENDRKRFIEPIKRNMLTPHMKTMAEYKQYIEDAGFKIIVFEDISSHVEKTWDICAKLISNSNTWKIALRHGKDFVNFLKAFQSMRKGYASKTFIYGLMVAKKI